MGKIGIMGGTFDPVHYGHLVTADEARWRFGLSAVIFVPNRHPPHKDPRDVSAPEHRYLMTFLATVTNPRFAVSRLEIERPGPSYTIDTIHELRRQYPNDDLYYITGADALEQILRGEWRETAQLLGLCRFIAANRPGYRLDQELWSSVTGPLRAHLHNVHTLEIPAMAISSTDLRARVRDGRPIRYLVPEAVEGYIVKHQLYANAAPPAGETPGARASGRTTARATEGSDAERGGDA
ncbi:MAG TPA: nicotinate-nucleotide adenylyltransferase [bacterium]|nr:nicotinate-nucleotide adenylyltransferase [bacterium]